MISEGNPASGSSDRQAKRDAAARALGLDPALVRWPGEEDVALSIQPAVAAPEEAPLSDEEWEALAPLLPAEAPQARSMPARDFLDCVLDAMRRGGRWTSRQTPAADIEAVRRRFGRWAHLGVFQGLAEVLPSLALSAESKRLLALACQRAAQLKARTARS